MNAARVALLAFAMGLVGGLALVGPAGIDEGGARGSAAAVAPEGTSADGLAPGAFEDEAIGCMAWPGDVTRRARILHAGKHLRLRPHELALQALALLPRAGAAPVPEERDVVRAALEGVLLARSETFTADPDVLGYDATLPAWGYTPRTFGWVIPTSYALLALRRGATILAADPGARARAREGIREGERFLVDRACREGGWNYGSPRVFGKDLAPDAEPTAMALLALGARPDGVATTDAALDRVATTARRILPALARESRSPRAVAWSMLALGEGPESELGGRLRALLGTREAAGLLGREDQALAKLATEGRFP